MTSRDRALAIFATVLWGSNFIAIHVGLAYFPPMLFAALRYVLIAVPTILLVPRPSGDLRPLIGYGVSFGGFQFVLLFFALNAGMPTGLSSVVLQAAAPMTVLLGVWLLHERFSARLLFGLVLAGGGLAAIALGRAQVATAGPVLLTLAAALAWAIGNLCLRIAKPDHPMRFILWSSVVPPVPLLAMSLTLEGPGTAWRAVAGSVTADGWPGAVALLVVTLTGTVIGMSIWTGLLARNQAATVAPYSMLVPVTGMACAWAVLGELPARIEAIGALAILAGVLLSSPVHLSDVRKVAGRGRTGEIADSV